MSAHTNRLVFKKNDQKHFTDCSWNTHVMWVINYKQWITFLSRHFSTRFSTVLRWIARDWSDTCKSAEKSHVANFTSLNLNFSSFGALDDVLTFALAHMKWYLICSDLDDRHCKNLGRCLCICMSVFVCVCVYVWVGVMLVLAGQKASSSFCSSQN